ncbi:hypothetical protein LZ554_008646 [Drepanopeziza brunnea f. sp. 'monogermtubi']|nr:hypothetical protein LZ554_008646 [Drepanopeziza brunnea f. sp. 'monogermtubi']
MEGTLEIQETRDGVYVLEYSQGAAYPSLYISNGARKEELERKGRGEQRGGGQGAQPASSEEEDNQSFVEDSHIIKSRYGPGGASTNPSIDYTDPDVSDAGIARSESTTTDGGTGARPSQNLGEGTQAWGSGAGSIRRQNMISTLGKIP